MMANEFGEHMQRLETTFPKFYSKERRRLIWLEVQHLHANQWIDIVDKLIGERRIAPLPSDFRDEVAFIREKQRRHERAQSAQDAKEFWSGETLIDDEEIKWRMGEIKARLLGQRTDEQYQSFLDYLKSRADANPQPDRDHHGKCMKCSGSGITAYDGPDGVYGVACDCESAVGLSPRIPRGVH